MATHAPTTPASAGALDFSPHLDAFETIAGDFASLRTLLRVAVNEFDLGEAGEAPGLLESALLVAAHIDGKFREVVETAYAVRAGRR